MFLNFRTRVENHTDMENPSEGNQHSQREALMTPKECQTKSDEDTPESSASILKTDEEREELMSLKECPTNSEEDLPEGNQSIQKPEEEREAPLSSKECQTQSQEDTPECNQNIKKTNEQRKAEMGSKEYQIKSDAQPSLKKQWNDQHNKVLQQLRGFDREKGLKKVQKKDDDTNADTSENLEDTKTKLCEVK